MSESNWNSPAPGELDFVRRFLNTWRIPDGTREPVDELPGLLKNTEAWEERFPGWKPGSGDTAELLTALRGDLRESLGGREGWVGRLNGWFERYPLVARVSGESKEASVQLRAATRRRIRGPYSGGRGREHGRGHLVPDQGLSRLPVGLLRQEPQQDEGVVRDVCWGGRQGVRHDLQGQALPAEEEGGRVGALSAGWIEPGHIR